MCGVHSAQMHVIEQRPHLFLMALPHHYTHMTRFTITNSLPLEKAFICNEILVYKKAKDRLDLLNFKIMLIAQPKNIFVRNTRNTLISDWLVAG